MGIFGPPNIEKMQAKRDVNGLIKALSFKKDARIRLEAAKSLGEYGDVPAVEPLIALLQDADENVRKAVVEALGKLRDPRAVSPLITTLKDASWDIRITAIQSLVKINDTRAVEPLIAALREWKNFNALKAVREALANFGGLAVTPLVAELNSSDVSVRWSAVEVLGRIGDPGAVEPLIAVLHGKKGQELSVNQFIFIQPPVEDISRKAAVEALGKIGALTVSTAIHQRIAQALIGVLKDMDRNVRVSANKTLPPFIGTLTTDEPLITAFTDGNEDVRKAALQALGETGSARAIDALITALRGEDKESFVSIILALGKIGSRFKDPALRERIIIPLVSLMDDPDEAIRTSASGALELLDWHPGADEKGVKYWLARGKPEKCVAMGAPAVEALIAELESAGWKTFSGIAQALGKIGDVRAVEPLLGAFQDTHEEVRKSASDALENIIKIHGFEPLVNLLNSDHKDIREAAARILSERGWKPAQDETGARFWIAQHKLDECIVIGSPAVKPLSDALQDTDTDIRIDAAKVLGMIAVQNQKSGSCAPAVEPLIAALQDGEKSVRIAVINTLGSVADKRAVDPLITALKDKDEQIRAAAAEALGKIAAQLVDVTLRTRVVNSLTTALKDNQSLVRAESAKALGIIADTRAVEPLIIAFKDDDKFVRLESARSLGSIGDKRSVEFLIFMLKDPEGSVRYSAVEALGKINDTRAVKPLLLTLKSIDKKIRRATAQALGNICVYLEDHALCTRSIDALIVALKEEDAGVRRVIENALEKIIDAHELEPLVIQLILALKDEIADVRAGSAWALGDIADPRAVEPLLDALQDESKDVRLASAWALGNIADPSAVKPLLPFLQEPDISIRCVAVEALGKIGLSLEDASLRDQVVKSLEKMMDDSIEIQRIAANALEKLGWIPGKDKYGAWYWIMRGDLEKCVDIGKPAIVPLITVLSDEPKYSKYLVFEEHFDTYLAMKVLVDIGDDRAVDPLLSFLTVGEWSARKYIAQLLVRLYTNGQINSSTRKKLLAQRNTITSTHTDRRIDRENNCGAHEDGHTDTGIGEDFPL